MNLAEWFQRMLDEQKWREEQARRMNMGSGHPGMSGMPSYMDGSGPMANPKGQVLQYYMNRQDQLPLEQMFDLESRKYKGLL